MLKLGHPAGLADPPRGSTHRRGDHESEHGHVFSPVSASIAARTLRQSASRSSRPGARSSRSRRVESGIAAASWRIVNRRRAQNATTSSELTPRSAGVAVVPMSAEMSDAVSGAVQTVGE